jgi:hypothetical protein
LDRDWYDFTGEHLMWQRIYDEQGDVTSGGWETFEEQLRGEHQPIVKVEMLNPDMEPVGSVIRSACACIDSAKGEITNLVSDGNIDVDTTRGTRRTAELTILNPSAEFTPATEDFDPEGAWVGRIYLNRNVRIWRGVHLGKRHLYVPVGTFMIDACDVLVEQNMSLVNLTMSDNWKKLAKSFWGNQIKYDKGTRINAIIRDIIDNAGVPLDGKFRAVLDDMSSRPDRDKEIGHNLKFERGESRGDRLKEMARKWGLDIYFDPMGIFRTEDRSEDRDKRTVWSFRSKAIDNANRNGGLISMKRSFNDDNLYNHVIVIGTGNEKGVVRASRADNNPASKTNIDTIGDRVRLIETDRISTEAQAERALDKAWKLRFQISEMIDAEVICNPALEGDDVVVVEEREFAKVDGRYRLQGFNIPLITSRQSVRCVNIIRGDDL